MTIDHKANTARIAKNTVFLYGRMLFGMIVSLYTSRVILNALGVVDFGIYGVVGGLVGMLSIVSGSLQASITRFLTYELGVSGEDRIRDTFSSAFFIQIILAFSVFVLGETIGLWALNSILNIPPDRIFAANIVYQASLVSFMLGLALMPYYACINAHEKMDVYAWLGLIDIGFKLGIVLFVAYAPFVFDKLIIYSLLLVGVGIVMQAIGVCYCRRHFNETKVKPVFNSGIIKAMTGFAGWNFIGASSALLRETGGNILLNIFFGPVVNASRTIASSVSNAVCGFTGNFNAAVNPQITKSYASGDWEYMHSLIRRSAKFGFMLMLFFALPIIFNTEAVLYIWLGEVPPYSVIFVILILVFSLLESISSPLISAQLATGKIRNYQIVVGGLQSLNFPLSLLLLWLGAVPPIIFLVAIILSICCLSARLIFLRKMIALHVRSFCGLVIVPCFIVTVVACILPSVLLLFPLEGNVLLILSVISCMCGTALASFFIGCKPSERLFIIEKVANLKKKIVLSCSI